MKFTVQQQDFLDGLLKAKGTLSASDTRAVLKNFAIKAKESKLSIVSTDLDLAMVCELDAQVDEPGVITIPGDQIVGIVTRAGALEITLDVDMESKLATVTSGRFSAKLACISAEDYPSIAEFPEDPQVLDRAPFLDILNKISFSICDNEARKNLLNVMMDGKKVMASDSHVSTIATMDTEIKNGVLIPSLAVRELIRILRKSESDNLEIGQTESFLMFRLGPDVFITRLSTGKFPDIEKRALKPTMKNDIVFEVDRVLLRDAVARVSCTASERSRAVKFDLTEGSLALTSFDRGGNSSEETLDAEFGLIDLEEQLKNGTPHTINKRDGDYSILFDHQYINDIMGSLVSDKIRFHLNSNIRIPARIQEDNFVVLLMRVADTVLREAAEEEAAKAGTDEVVDEL